MLRPSLVSPHCLPGDKQHPILLACFPHSGCTFGLPLRLKKFSISSKVQLRFHLGLSLFICFFLAPQNPPLVVQGLVMRLPGLVSVTSSPQLCAEENKNSYNILIAYYGPKISQAPLKYHCI